MFPYQKLDTDSTLRLIQVLPDLGDDEILCEIQTVDMKASPNFEYHALSYVWGEATPTTPIFLQDGKTKKRYLQSVRKNLWQFLHQIKRQVKQSLAACGSPATKTALLLIWTDALCLNQGDKQEKEQQIPRMDTIYSQAKTVLVWLGIDNGLPRELQRLYDCGDDVGFYDALGIHNLDATDKDSNCELAKHPYWRRIWIVQEFVLASELRIMAGDIAMDFSRLERQLMLNDGVRHSRRALLAMGWNWIGETIDLRAAEKHRKRWPLWKIIRCFWGYNRSEIADGVYGILGLVGNNSDGTSPKESIRVDYKMRTVDIFFDTIFEMCAPPNEYLALLPELHVTLRDKYGNGPLHTHSAFEKYLTGKSTSNRQKRLATTASRVNDAMRILHTHPSMRPQGTKDDPSSFPFIASHIFGEPTPSHLLKNPTVQSDVDKITLDQHAAIIGFLLAGDPHLTVEEVLRNDPWPNEAHPVKGPSQWRCAVHRVPQGNPTETRVWRDQCYLWSDTDLVAFKFCGEHDGSCDARGLTFEILEIGFSIQIEVKESAPSGWKTVGLSLRLFNTV